MAGRWLRPSRVPSGMPRGREDWRGGATASFLLHALVVLLIVAPFALTKDITLIEQGAGGAGPAGGGGGGTRGTGGVRHETLRYVTIAPPVAPSPPPPVVPPPVQPKIELPKPELPAVEAPRIAPLSPIAGVGGGTGTDGTAGSGTGSGGGVGTGVGTGKGSGVGAGTGGGRTENYPPTPIEMFIPPMPVPRSARGAKLVVQFDVDEVGKVRGIEFTPTPDRGYNRRLREVFETFRFRPGTRPDGTPVRMKFQLEIDLP
jgi:protein TonB